MIDVRAHTLPNGCKILLRPTPDKAILSMVAAVRWGARDDPADQAGLSHLMARLLTKGTASRTAFEIAQTLESVGGDIEAFCGQDFLGLETQTVETDWRIALDVLTDCLFHPSFTAEEFDKERSLIQAEIRRAEDDKFSFTYRRLECLFYRGHLYGTPAEGEVETVASLDHESIRALHAAIARPESIVLVVVGNVPDEEFLAAIAMTWPAGPVRPAGSPPERDQAVRRRLEPEQAPGAGRGETVVLTKEVEQAFVVLGYPAERPGLPESAALRLACGVLGEGMSARLFSRLRDRDHLAYAVGSSLVGRELASHLFLYIGTNPATVEIARDRMRREAENLADEPPDDAELERARQYMLGRYLIGRQTNAALARSMATTEIWGLGWEWGEHFPERIKAVAADQVVSAARRYLTNPATAVLVPSPG